MEIKEFVSGTIKALDKQSFEKLKEKMIGEYLSINFIDENAIDTDVFAEKVYDYFEKVELDSGNEFEKICSTYMNNWKDVVERYMPKEPSAKKGEPVPPMSRSLKYFKYTIETINSRNITMKQLAEYSRIMMSLYMKIIKSGMKEVDNFDFSTDNFDLDKILSSLKAEKAGTIIPIGKKNYFDIKEPYCTDTATFVITMIMFYFIRTKAIKGDD